MLNRLRNLMRSEAPPPAPPADVDAALREAMTHAKAGRHGDALGLLQALQRSHPGHVPLLSALGQVRLFRAQAEARSDLAHGVRPRDHVRGGSRSPRVSVVIPSITPEKYARASASFDAALAGLEHEIVGVHDARSMCEACNRGVAASRGDVLVFTHDDVEVASPDFAARLLDALDAADVVGIAGTSRIAGAAWAASGPPHIHGQVGYRGDRGAIEVVAFGLDAPVRADAQALDGCFMAARREVLEELRFDDATFTGWHLYDVDFTVSAWLAGFSVAVREDLLVIHQSRGRYDERWQRDAARFAAKHRAALPPPAPITPIAVPGLVVAGIDEWRLVTERLTAGEHAC